MKYFIRVIAVLICFSLFAWANAVASQKANTAILLHLNSAIGPATQDYVHRGLEQAIKNNSSALILQIDTPGGLDKSMRGIIQDIIASPIPVICYVAPEGARAASAGTYILYSCSIAAMAPATNLGAASPVNITSAFGNPAGEENKKIKPLTTLEQKEINDAAAYIHSLADLHHRNATWAEQAVRQGTSLPALEALKLGVIDLIANNTADLLKQTDGRVVLVNDHPYQLHTKDLKIETIEPDWRSRLLAVITDPSVAYILLLIGVYGIFFEFFNPGFMLPGVIGGICLLLALYALQLLPINYAGLGLILLGIIFMGLEALAPSGALAIGGIIAFVSGSILLLDVSSGYAIPRLLILTMSVITATFFAFLILLVLRSRRRKVVSGREELLGMTVEAIEDFTTDGWVKAHGELWRAHSTQPLKKGQRVKVTGIDGLVLQVKPENNHV